MMDTQYGAIDGVAFEQALTVLATLISLHADWAIVDAGYKALSIDGAPPRPLLGDARFELVGDEHGKLTFGRSAPPAVGTTIQIHPGSLRYDGQPLQRVRRAPQRHRRRPLAHRRPPPRDAENTAP